MAEKFTISLQKIIDEFKLEVIHTPKNPEEILIDEKINFNAEGIKFLESCGVKINKLELKGR